MADGLKNNLVRKPDGNDRSQAKAIWAGECDLALGNTYYVGLMLTDTKEPEQKEWAGAIKVLFPNAKDRGTHVNVSGMALAKYAPDKENAIKLMEFLSSKEAQQIYAEQVFEYPVLPGAEPSAIVKSFGEIHPDKLPLTDVAKYRKQASELSTRSASTTVRRNKLTAGFELNRAGRQRSALFCLRLSGLARPLLDHLLAIRHAGMRVEHAGFLRPHIQLLLKRGKEAGERQRIFSRLRHQDHGIMVRLALGLPRIGEGEEGGAIGQHILHRAADIAGNQHDQAGRARRAVDLPQRMLPVDVADFVGQHGENQIGIVARDIDQFVGQDDRA